MTMDGLIILWKANSWKRDQTRKTIIKIFKDIGFKIEIKNNVKTVHFLDITFNLTITIAHKRNTMIIYHAYKHPQITDHKLPEHISEGLLKNPSSWRYDTAKQDYENVLKDSG